MEVTWNDGYNAPFVGDVVVDPAAGVGEGQFSVSDSINEGLDRVALLEVESDGGTVKKEVSVKHKGKRLALCTADGLPFYTSDLASFNLLPPPPLYDKVIFDDSIIDPANISGDVNGNIIQQIRSKIRRCLAKKTDDGVAICYLNHDNSNFYHDGVTPSVLTGEEGDVMVAFPDIYTKFTLIDADKHKFSYNFSLENIDGAYRNNSGFLLGAYEAVIDSNNSYSRSGIESTGAVSQTNHKTYAHARGTGYQLVDYDMSKIIAWLFYAIYGTRNCQATCGVGVYSSDKVNGQTDSLGDRDTDSTNGNTMSVNFLGLENCWGNKYEMIDNVVVGYPTMKITDTVTGAVRNVNIPVSASGWHYPNTLLAGDEMDIVAADAADSDSTGYCDGQNYGSTAGRVLWRSGSSSSASGGVAFARASYDPSSMYANVGSRLAYRGKTTEIFDIAEFKALPLL